MLRDPRRGPEGLGVGEGSGRIVRGRRLGGGERGMGSASAKGEGVGPIGTGDWRGQIGAGRRVERLGGNAGGGWGIRSLQNWGKRNGDGGGKRSWGVWCREKALP